MRVIYTSKGMSKKFGVRVIYRKIRYIFFISLTSIGTFPKLWAASVWKNVLCFLRVAPISLTGCTTPNSLFAMITEARIVLSVIAFSSIDKSVIPFCLIGKYVTSNHSFSSCRILWLHRRICGPSLTEKLCGEYLCCVRIDKETRHRPDRVFVVNNYTLVGRICQNWGFNR